MTDEQHVEVLLAVAGITPDPHEMAALLGNYQVVRMMAEMVHGVEAARYEVPALGFDAQPRFGPDS